MMRWRRNTKQHGTTSHDRLLKYRSVLKRQHNGSVLCCPFRANMRGKSSDIGLCPMLVCVVPVAHEALNLTPIKRGVGLSGGCETAPQI